MTYKQAYDKIIDAYFKDEIEPYNSKFCFCGNLCDKTADWYVHFTVTEHNPSHGYSGKELFEMEQALFSPLDIDDHGNEDLLFAGMCAALEVLKQIHIDRGENIDEVPVFTKRQLYANISKEE